MVLTLENLSENKCAVFNDISKEQLRDVFKDATTESLGEYLLALTNDSWVRLHTGEALANLYTKIISVLPANTPKKEFDVFSDVIGTHSTADAVESYDFVFSENRAFFDLHLRWAFKANHDAEITESQFHLYQVQESYSQGSHIVQALLDEKPSLDDELPSGKKLIDIVLSKGTQPQMASVLARYKAEKGEEVYKNVLRENWKSILLIYRKTEDKNNLAEGNLVSRECSIDLIQQLAREGLDLYALVNEVIEEKKDDLNVEEACLLTVIILALDPEEKKELAEKLGFFLIYTILYYYNGDQETFFHRDIEAFLGNLDSDIVSKLLTARNENHRCLIDLAVYYRESAETLRALIKFMSPEDLNKILEDKVHEGKTIIEVCDENPEERKHLKEVLVKPNDRTGEVKEPETINLSAAGETTQQTTTVVEDAGDEPPPRRSMDTQSGDSRDDKVLERRGTLSKLMFWKKKK